jgi:transposase InsO family protein
VKIRKAQYRAIYALKNKHCVKEMLEILQIPQSSYYKWLKKASKPDEDIFYYDLIKEIQDKTKQTYGYRRVTMALLKEHGLVVNHKKTLRIMNKYNLLSVIRRKYLYRGSPTLFKYNNLFERKFRPNRPNEKWSTDISYIITKEGVLYLSAIKDCFDSSIVAYRYSTTMNNNLVINTIKDAIKNEKAADGLILHSDQGNQYKSIEYNKLVKSYNITPSMSRAGTPIDNSPIESFFGTFKSECIYIEKPKTIEQAKELVDDYIDFYNNHRIQLKSKLTPGEIRQKSLSG